MGTLEFLRENVGKFFMYGGERCRLVGIKFDSDSSFLVIEARNGWLAKARQIRADVGRQS